MPAHPSAGTQPRSPAGHGGERSSENAIPAEPLDAGLREESRNVARGASPWPQGRMDS